MTIQRLLLSLTLLAGLATAACGADQDVGEGDDSSAPRTEAPVVDSPPTVELVTATEPAPAAAPAELTSLGAGEELLEGGLRILDDKVGDGALAETGKTVKVHYTGTLLDGTKFDSSLDRGKPLEFVLGQSAMIQGFHQGIPGMKVGGTRRLGIPPALAYGEQGHSAGIPPNSPLLFTIELLEVK